MQVADQIVTMLATVEGLFDDIPLEKVGEASEAVRRYVREKHGDICDRITGREKLDADMRKILVETGREALRISGFTKAEG